MLALHDFERLKNFTNSKYIISQLMVPAIHLALLSLKVKSNEEILMPSLNYIASANACLYIGAVPHLLRQKRVV